MHGDLARSFLSDKTQNPSKPSLCPTASTGQWLHPHVAALGQSQHRAPARAVPVISPHAGGAVQKGRLERPCWGPATACQAEHWLAVTLPSGDRGAQCPAPGSRRCPASPGWLCPQHRGGQEWQHRAWREEEEVEGIGGEAGRGRGET